MRNGQDHGTEPAALEDLLEHCRTSHPSPWDWPHLAGVMGTPDQPGECERCAELNPARFVECWHHTDPAAAAAILRSQRFLATSGWVYFTNLHSAVDEQRQPGICPRGRGAVLGVRVPSGIARLDAVLPGGEVNWRVHVKDLHDAGHRSRERLITRETSAES